jgi:hypothetical protein
MAAAAVGLSFWAGVIMLFAGATGGQDTGCVLSGCGLILLALVLGAVFLALGLV